MKTLNSSDYLSSISSSTSSSYASSIATAKSNSNSSSCNSDELYSHNLLNQLLSSKQPDNTGFYERSMVITPCRATSVIMNSKQNRKNEYYTLTGHNQQQSRHFSKYYYQQVGTFLTQFKIRENYKFLQMISVPPLDPAVPKPEGCLSVPACGEPLVVPASFPQSLEAAIHKFANASSKATCISVLDQYGKPISSLTYG